MLNFVKKNIRNTFNKWYLPASKLYHYKLQRSLLNQPFVVLVYQMGKVGSSSVVKSLKSNNFCAYNVHTFNAANLERTEKLFKSLWVKNGPLPVTLWEQQFFSKYVKNKNINRKIKIISLVRDPVARNISHFFQYPNMIMKETNGGYHVSSPRYGYSRHLKETSVESELTELFFKNMDNHEVPLQWFDSELKKNFSIDVYGSEFPKERGYRLYRNEIVEVMLIKLEMLDTVFSQSIREFLSQPGVALVKANVGTKKDSARLYKKFLRFLKLPDDYLDHFYGSKFANHFYTEEELSAFKKKWQW